MHFLHKQLIFNVNSHFQANNFDLIAQMTAANSCIAVLPEFLIKPLLKQNKLKICLPEFKLPESSLYAVYPKKKLLPQKVKVLIELLKTHLAKI